MTIPEAIIIGIPAIAFIAALVWLLDQVRIAPYACHICGKEFGKDRDAWLSHVKNCGKP